ncbi:unnamed protein product [Trichobilharzia szidati]|nr:unnamed protein product [Trichobilharzia szidati]
MTENSNSKDVVRFYDEAARISGSNSLLHRRQASIFYLRNFNNWTKGIFIANSLERLNVPYKRARVLDLCCGKGGDQLKWLRGAVQHVTFVDISSESVEVCRQRYEQMCRNKWSVFTADFFVADCTEVILSQILPSGIMYNLVSCQFALHYAFESLNQARRILSNISSLLQENGYFIASIPNAYELVRRANAAVNDHAQKSSSKSDVKEITFGNSVYSVTFPATSFSAKRLENEKGSTVQLTFPLFGAKYSFHLDGVVDCPEYLVYPPLLDKLAADYNLIPSQKCISFAKHFYTALTSRSSVQEPTELLVKMEALESRYCDSDDKFTDCSEYSHLREHQNDQHQRTSCFGTLSKSEWEVTTMYSLVAYQKKLNKT